MHAAIAVPGNSRSILTHVFGLGLEDKRYVVERYQAMADGDIRRIHSNEPAKRSGAKAKRAHAPSKLGRCGELGAAHPPRAHRERAGRGRDLGDGHDHAAAVGHAHLLMTVQRCAYSLQRLIPLAPGAHDVACLPTTGRPG